ncbi:MAG: hypothetical protein ACOYJB_05605 [Christensenellaceae bacterium]|jgi:hypothetical protein
MSYKVIDQKTTDESYFTETDAPKEYDKNTTLQNFPDDGTVTSADYEGAYDEMMRDKK